ncbi:MAG: glucose 1-dehydrogenase [Candidatus Hydrogenedentes bacterium]|nr:glucose 1-dehydrogenase [Candidatus Hydrogenedentota bacterium]
MAIVSFSLKDKIALVTGASRGIGEAIARCFAENGATVILTARKQEGLDTVAAAINGAGGKAVAIACHAGQSDSIAALFAQIKERFGRLDILVNNAATNPYFGPAMHISESAFDKTMEVNVKGYFLMMQHAAPMMVEQNGGSIINVASIAGISPGPMQVVYSMTKGAVINMTKGFAKELGSANVRVNAIAPGVVETKFAQVLIDTEEIHDRIVGMTALGRHAQPNEIAGAALYLASDAGSYTTGAVIVVDGGSTA